MRTMTLLFSYKTSWHEHHAHLIERGGLVRQHLKHSWNSPAGRLVSALVIGHADAEANCVR